MVNLHFRRDEQGPNEREEVAALGEKAAALQKTISGMESYSAARTGL